MNNLLLNHLSKTKILFLIFLVLYFLVLYNYTRNHFGWQSWFDQSQYLKEATAILHLDRTPSNYYYFPLYPFFGIFSFSSFKNDPFFVINLICFITFFYYYFNFIRFYIGSFLAFFSIVFCLFQVKTMMIHWSIPWTTTLVAPLLIIFFLILRQVFNYKKIINTKFIALLSLIAGFIFLTRPVDIITLTPSFLYLIFIIIQKKNNIIKNFLTLISICFAFCVSLFYFNYLIFGDLTGSYFTSTAGNVGFYFPNIPSKFYSIFIDSKPIFNIEGEAIFQKMPLLYLSIPSIIYGLFFGGLILRLLIAGIILQIGIYLAYSDFLPIGLWKFNNAHYFKFILPVIIFLIFNMLKGIIDYTDKFKINLLKFTLVTLLSLPFYFLRIHLHDHTSSWTIKIVSLHLEEISLQLNSNNQNTIHKIDFPNIKGEFNDIYFGEHSVISDNIVLSIYKDFRIVPLVNSSQNVNGISVIFIRPMIATDIKLVLKKLHYDNDMSHFNIFTCSFIF